MREEPFEAWLERLIEETSAAWITVGVLLRLMEDHAVAPPYFVSAGDARRDEWLAQFAAVLLPAQSHPAWTLTLPEFARHELVALFREEASGAPRWREAVRAPSFMAMLYDELIHEQKEELALVSTPDFVADFLVERTVEPAAREFGLEALRIMDPACGSGQLLVAAFHKLLALREERGDRVDELAVRTVLGQLLGNDVSLFSYAFTRCALIRAYLEHPRAPEQVRLDELPLAIELRDSLLDFAGGDSSGRLSPGRYPVVLVEPPSIRELSQSRRELFRRCFKSAHQNFSLGPLFLELALELAAEEGFVGALLDKSFMRRESGRPLIEEVLPRHELTCVVDTSGVYLPGHGVPTLMLFARKQLPRSDRVRVVLSQRGEPGTPSVPRMGKVWTEILSQIDTPSFEGAFISVTEVPRSVLARHPWSLMTGTDLEAAHALERGSLATLGELAELRGGALGGAGGLVAPPDVFLRQNLSRQSLRFLIQGYGLTNWASSWVEPHALPDLSQHETAERVESLLRRYMGGLVPRGPLAQKDEDCRGAVLQAFSRGCVEPGERDVLVFPAVAAQNHFCRAEPGQYAALSVGRLELRWPRAQEERSLALLAYLNSSTALFWMRQTLNAKFRSGTQGLRTADAASSMIFKFGSKVLERLPVPAAVVEEGWIQLRLAACARNLEQLADRHRRSAPQVLLGSGEAQEELPGVARHDWRGRSRSALVRALTWARHEEEVLFRRMVAEQEEIDWLVYSALGLASIQPVEHGEALPDQRPFAWVDSEPPAGLDPLLLKEWKERWRQRHGRSELVSLDAKPCKRQWQSHSLKRRGEREDERVREACEQWLLSAIERSFQRQAPAVPMTVQQIAEALAATPDAVAVAELFEGRPAPDMSRLLAPLLEAKALPFLRSWRLRDSGLEKSRSWAELWARARGGSVSVGEARRLAVPYSQEDFRSTSYWLLRGRLDFPHERFIRYPARGDGGERETLYGWAGWTPLQQASALQKLYQEGVAGSWTRDRLLPILQGIEELLPGVQDWHAASASGLEAFMHEQFSALGIEWRP